MPAAARRASAKRIRRDVDEELPLFAGRLMIGAVVLGLMVLITMSKLGDWLEPKQQAAAQGTNPTDSAPGTTGRVQITLITADYNLLTCASPQVIEGKHCAYRSETEVWPRPENAPLDENKRDVIQPYRTWPDNRLILVAGLWADPAVALRLHREPPTGVAQKKLSRFVADCQMKFLGKLQNPRLRWPTSGQWLNEGDATVAQPLSCEIHTTED
jgi:hypothetical protein